MDGIGLFEVLYTDFTELRFANGTRKAYLMPIIGHASKLAFGWAVSAHANTETAVTARPVSNRHKQCFWYLSVTRNTRDQGAIFLGHPEITSFGQNS